MENQINVGDQNTQQISNNPTSQLTDVREKPKTNYWMTSTIVLLVLLLGSITLFLSKSNKQREPIEIIPTPTVTSGIKESPTIRPTEASNVKLGWKLYKDEKVGYSIQYPNTWFSNNEVNNLMGGDTQILWLTTHKDLPSYQAADLGLGDNMRMGINYRKNTEKISLKELMKKHVKQDFADNPPESVKSTWTTVDGLEAHRYVYYPDNKWGTPGVYTTIKMSNGDFISLDAAILHEFDTYLNQVIEVENSFKVL